MDKKLQPFKHLKIQLEEITSATNNFDDEKKIGDGGFGNVYRGELSHSKGRSTVAIKRLDDSNGQGDAEFMKEITALSRYEHENLISLLGFCYEEGAEAILVYQLASRGSLEKYLGSPDLTWTLRLEICLGAAKGLRHLHDPKETHQRLIHCDVKSGNILLDDHWHAMVADFGFSTMGPANELQSTVVNRAAGTYGYCDPEYRNTSTLTKESDVYSFGVVLVEVLCGALCYTLDSNGSAEYNLVPTWKKSYEEKTLNDTIFKDSAIQMHESVLERFSDIAFQCLKESREERPTMEEVVRELESALNIHELHQNPEFRDNWNKQSFTYNEMAKTAGPPLKYRSEDELMALLSKGVLLNEGKTYFSINKKGQHCEMISIAECLRSAPSELDQGWPQIYNSRFVSRTYHSEDGIFKTGVRSQFLSPGITYTVNLVLKFTYLHPSEMRNGRHLFIKYKLQGETETSVSYLAYDREDGWWMAELYQFTCDHKTIHLPILFDGFVTRHRSIEVEGIEFRPLEKLVEHKDENEPILDSNSDSDANWEEKLPTDYEHIMKLSEKSLQWTTKKEAYSIICQGLFIRIDNKTSIWFSLDKNGKKCHMLSVEAFTHIRNWQMLRISDSRFRKAAPCDLAADIWIRHKIQSQLVSPDTTYAIYLVYKLPQDQSRFETPVLVYDKQYLDGRSTGHFYLVSPQTPVIKRKADDNTHNPLNRPKIKGLPQQRNDGWMEVQIWEIPANTEMISLDMRSSCRKELSGIIVQGFEFRPI